MEIKAKKKELSKREYEGNIYGSYDGVHWNLIKEKKKPKKKIMKYKHYATSRIIEVVYADVDETVVYCKELDKRFRISEEPKRHLEGTSYMEEK